MIVNFVLMSSYLETLAGIFERVWGPGIDSKEWIPPAYVAWRAGTITLFLLGSLAHRDCLQIAAQGSITFMYSIP